jgi:mannose-6-phosphate isomerase-like protein (cupin superfamily)
MAGEATGNDPADQRQGPLAWVADIEEATLGNTNFRAVLFTGEHTQLTVMRLRAGEEIGWEQHSHLDQFLRVEQGSGRLDVGRSGDAVDEQHEVQDDWAIIIPAGTWHNVVNTGAGDLHLYSLYSPPEHPPGTVHVTKADADAAEHDHD